ncbi:Phosphatidylinositol N-acetylglucosaminyltransferase subunit Y, putative [Trypanosoma equiperdum]|uniref:Phosphatidylinositol N-acetylglucosaminyltransferase subunit Y n=4 Tax=Trypanozoon TaxID=39700 RepID=Q580A6_TRYB2|nr:hypothetical protein, conserved [Trypanosoma brucei gambiense DAL972]XP_844228.1 hypothetical protein, conserved [Trypanosoma brucei brucei TREU927]AAX80963.1 hypothetical protein, conserved [Trypanosoma brucei]RHW72927.1 Phosphatidylinositol N-acetylglucosaminyltransferase subunit Y [Trypanosoma brucei equiperdum]SCU65389.1 Phosphatidylinositol N-acetylglucosaminyltransferase subunit Y, putative [Trypanosoma equiperdum]AAZ10669.1 hypothetical protein, conserved [Trypanosoma brucei brucei T|eukprot:XP_011772642.1 hypothetical protein, conserved [Trypanosoma brucei gambiense DAL972]
MYALDYRNQPLKCFLLGWPSLITAWAGVLWFVLCMWECLNRPIERSERSVMDPMWYRALIPPLVPPVIVVAAYFSWLGWKIFTHN